MKDEDLLYVDDMIYRMLIIRWLMDDWDLLYVDDG